MPFGNCFVSIFFIFFYFYFVSFRFLLVRRSFLRDGITKHIRGVAAQSAQCAGCIDDGGKKNLSSREIKTNAAGRFDDEE
jgi:hypothetical protein